MHYFQQRYLVEASTFPAAAGLLTIDLPNKGLLSGIEIRVQGINGDNSAKNQVWLHDRLKKFEVMVNGSQVVKSYDGRQLLAMMLHKRTPILDHDAKNMNGASAKEYFYINLGRHYHDLEYMLDLSQVNDPELRIEYDFGMLGAAGWNEGVSMVEPWPSYYIICHMLRDTALVPKGYIKTAEIHRVDNATGLGYNLTVPRGPTYSNLYLQSWWVGMGIGQIVEHAEMNINSDNIIPWRVRPEDWEAQIVRLYGGNFQMQQQCHPTGAQAYPFPLEQGWWYSRMAENVDADGAGGDLWGNSAAYQYRVDSTGLAGAASIHSFLIYTGIAPFSVWPITILNPWDPETWIDTHVLGDFWIRVEETVGAKVGVMKLLGDEVVTKYTTPSWP